MYTVVKKKKNLRYTVLRQQKLTPGGKAVFMIAAVTLHQLPYQSSGEEFIEIRSIMWHKPYELF